jgi:hypothetical protein
MIISSVQFAPRSAYNFGDGVTRQGMGGLRKAQLLPVVSAASP